VRDAAAEAKRQLLQTAATLVETEPQHPYVSEGKILIAGPSGGGVAIEDITKHIAPHMILGYGARGPNPQDKSVRTFGVQCAEVEVDVESGEITVLRVVAAHDCGRIVNPVLVDSQVIGGVTQGLGFALSEERVVDACRGVVLNANLEEYKVMTVADVPAIVHAHVDVPDAEANSTGAKGIGEPPIVPTAPAIANAVFNAVGVRLRHTPLSRQRLLEAFSASLARHPLSPLPLEENSAEGTAIATPPITRTAHQDKVRGGEGG
jgi:xanthine dehydrogenase YagR molybdenum-binding subunit